MQQRHSIRADKGRVVPVGGDRGSTPISFHKIYRQRRGHPVLDKGKDGHSGSQWGHSSSQREDSSSQWGHSSSQREDSSSQWGHSSSQWENSSSQWGHSSSQFEKSNSSSQWENYSSKWGHSSSQCEKSNSQRENLSSQWGHSSSQWESASSQRRNLNSQWRPERSHSPRESITAIEPKYAAVPSGYNTTRRSDYKGSIRPGSQFSSFANTESPKSDHEYFKRSYGRFSYNSSSGSEFDTPLFKKQKVECDRPSVPQCHVSPDFEHGWQKIALEATKWMYKNQHAKMSGPYGVKQLMEGLQARFLQEDLPIFQLVEGKLCKPITLKQLMNDLQRSQCDSVGEHLNQSLPGRLPGSAEETTTGVANEFDFPPGFGGLSGQASEKSSCLYSPTSPTSYAGPRCSARAFTSSTTEIGDADFDLPPGFEGGGASESQTTGFSETPGRLSVGVGVAALRDGLGALPLSYDQVQPEVHDRLHSSWQGTSPHLNSSFMKQGPKTGVEVSSNGHTSWAYAPLRPSFESPTFSQSTVCIGLPVSKPATQSWPIACNLPSGGSTAESYNYLDSSTRGNTAVSNKDSVGLSERHSPDPLFLILSELLAAVKKTYVNSVLSALIGERLDCWLESNRIWTDTFLPSDKESFSKGINGLLSRPEVLTVSAETSTLHTEASAALTQHADISSEGMDAQPSEGSCLVTYVASSDENQLCHLTETKNNMYPGSSVVMAETLVSGNIEENAFNSSRLSPSSGNARNSSHDDKVESCFPVDSCNLSSNSSRSLAGSEPIQTSSVVMEKLQLDSEKEKFCDDEYNGRLLSGSTSDPVPAEAEPLILASQTKRVNVKSLKQLIMITSKLRSGSKRRGVLKKKGSEKKNGRELSLKSSPEVPRIIEWLQRSAFENYDGCSRTSLCGWLWHNQAIDARCAGIGQNETQGSESAGMGISVHMQTPAQSAETHSESLVAFPDGLDPTQLRLSKASKKMFKVARSKIHRWGLLLVEPVRAGDFVVEYFGELVRSKIADIREERYAKLGIGSNYLFRIDNEIVVDATKRGGLARFINHSCNEAYSGWRRAYLRLYLCARNVEYFLQMWLYRVSRIIMNESLLLWQGVELALILLLSDWTRKIKCWACMLVQLDSSGFFQQ